MFKPDALSLALFERQFEKDRGFLTYRRDGVGAAYHVTDEQKAAWTAQFVRDQRRAQAGLVAATILVIVGMALFIMQTGDQLDSIASWAMVGAALFIVVAMFVWINRYARRRPEASLVLAAPVAPPLRREEVRAKHLSNLSYGQLALAPLLGLAAVLNFSDRVDPTHGWGRLIWLIPAGLALSAALQAIRKRRLAGDR
jgi:hypothetical protein